MRLFARLILKAATLAAASAQAAVPWTSDVPLMAPGTGTPLTSVISIAAEADGGYYAHLERSDGQHELVRFDGDHQVLSRHRRIYGESAYAQTPLAGLTMLDGELYSVGYQGAVARLAVDGSVVWASKPLFESFSVRSYCSKPVKSPMSALWVRCYDERLRRHNVQRVDRVGRHRKVIEPLLGELNAMTLASDGGVYVTGSRSGSPYLWRLNAAGEQQWYERVTAPANTTIDAILELPSGNPLLVARTQYERPLQLIEIDGTGAEVNRSEIDLGFAPVDLALAEVGADGSLLLIVGGAATQTDSLVQISADRQLDWLSTLPAGRSIVPDSLYRYATLDAAAEVRLVAERSISVDGTFRQFYTYFVVTGEGEIRHEVELGDEFTVSGFEPRPAVGDLLIAKNYSQLDGQGRVTPLSLPDLSANQERPVVRASHSEGTERYAVVDRRSGRELQAWDRAGNSRWVAPLERLVDRAQEPTIHELQVSDQALCWSAADATVDGPVVAPVQCFDRNTGAALLSFQPTSPFNTQPFRSKLGFVLLSNGVIARFVDGDGVRSLRFQSVVDGTDILPTIAVSENASLYGRAGGAGVALVDSHSEVIWVDGAQPERQSFVPEFGDKFVLSRGLIQASRWQARGSDVSIELFPGLSLDLQIADAAEPVVLARTLSYGTELYAFDSTSGSVAWTRTISAIGRAHEARVVDAGSPGEVLLVAANDADFDLFRLDRSDGSTRDVRSFECGAEPCRFLLTGHIDGESGLDLMSLQGQAETASALRSLHLDPPAAAARADQPGVAGIWYHAGLQGQGLVLTYLPATRTLFSPWFTYELFEAVHDQSGNRWYSLQGQAEPGAALVELDLLLNGSGQFAAPPQTVAESIGDATLRFHSCNRASLEYRFDQASLGAATLPLIRLGPRTQTCTLTDASVEPPEIAVADNAGFSTTLSGAWFDPASSGQGLMLEVVPASAADPGLLFAAWFSYDLADLANDYDRQDWFILQSDLGTAVAGRATVPIYRSIGGQHAVSATSNLFRIGEADLEFRSCDSMQIDFRFDDDEIAEEHRGLQGQLLLQRISGCGQ